jgi:hypothetical protein
MAKTRKSRAPARRRKQRGGYDTTDLFLLEITLKMNENVQEDIVETLTPEQQAAVDALLDRFNVNYENHNPNETTLQAHIRTFPADTMVQDIFSNDSVSGLFDGAVCRFVEAYWLPNEFSICSRVHTNIMEDELLSYLHDYDLEEGEYTAINDNGWVIHVPHTDLDYVTVDFDRDDILIEEVRPVGNGDGDEQLDGPIALQNNQQGGKRGKRKSRRITRKKRRGGRR